MNSRIRMLMVIGCVAILSGLGTAWLAYGQVADTPAGFEKPLVRDLKLVSDVASLTRRVEELEAKVKVLESKSATKQTIPKKTFF